MFKVAEKTELSQISLTGMRAIVMLGLLIVRPRSLDELREAFIELNIMERSHSDDILRIDMNTLKYMGCEISRACPKTDFKYVLTKHPFELKINPNEIVLLKRIYNKVKQTADLPLLIEFHELFNKIATFVFTEETKEALLGISILKYFDMALLKDLMLDCKHKRKLSLVYKKPTSKIPEFKNIVADSIEFKNDKIYLFGCDSRDERPTMLNVKRIRRVDFRDFKSSNIEPKTFKVLFHLKGFGIDEIEDSEKILSTDESGYIVEGSYYNDFIAAQRMLFFGVDCTVIEPLDFKNNIIQKLKEMRQNYD